MDIQSLRLFLHLSQTLSFRRTSDSCHLSASTLSRVIKRLEAEVGNQLLYRDNRTVSLTSSGQAFQSYARESIERWEELQLQLKGESDSLRGQISMYCSVTASYSFLADILVKFRSHHPNIDIKLRTGDAAESIPKVLNGEADIVVAAKPDTLPSTLNFVPIKQTPLLFIAPTVDCIVVEVIRESKGVMDWSRIPMILSERGLARKRVDEWFKAQKVTPQVYAQVSGSEAIVSMVSLGFGVGVVPKLVLSNSALAKSIQVLDITPELEAFSVGLCVLKRKTSSPLISAFWEVALESLSF